MELLTCAVAAVLLICVTNVQTARFPDWLVQKIDIPTQLQYMKDGNLKLSNSLISREFSIKPDFATVDYYSHEKQSSLLRAIGPEAVISLDGIVYQVGGIHTSMPRAYLNRTALKQDMRKNNDSFHFTSYETHKPVAPFPYKPKRGAPKDIIWPPKGMRLDVHFKAPDGAPFTHKAIDVTVHYEMYDGVPILSKWVTVSAPDYIRGNVTLAVLSVEYLAVNWQWAENGYGWMFVQADRPHGPEIKWEKDPSSGKMPGSFETVMSASYSLTPFLKLQNDFTSFRVMELIVGSSDPERFGLAKRKMLRLLAPHTQENPIFFHIIHSDNRSVRAAIDQMAEVGFELLSYSFGSNFDIESTDEKYIAKIATDVAYARERGIEVGGYDLISLTRRVRKEWMAVQKHTAPSACFASGWADYLLDRVLNFIRRTGISYIATDGPYGGYPCSSTKHSHHQGYQDSIYMQDLIQGKFYTKLRELGLYIGQPDVYFYQGGSKTGMGYNEHQYSLPHWQDLSISRQGMFDDTFHYTPTVGWMFFPLTVYHGGGSAAAFEPLTRNKEAYNWGLGQYMGAGVIATYRGYRLYDSNITKAIVKKWVSFYKKYRDIVTSDIIHVRRADMQSLDCYMHVNPFLQNKGLAMVFNPTDESQKMNLTLPIYYTGISKMAFLSQEGGPFKPFDVERDYSIDVNVELKPREITWYLIQGM